MNLSRDARRDHLFNRFLSVSQRFNFIAYSCPMFAPINSNINFLLKKIENLEMLGPRSKNYQTGQDDITVMTMSKSMLW